jgi:hypothetical protein
MLAPPGGATPGTPRPPRLAGRMAKSAIISNPPSGAESAR